ncbi:Demethylmenaquinone methyltransferase [Anatilimnocola aggregata]|uniref:Demethylmenaquinone methyltransferase n=1 Tax=Anatilimnocola aggregata TaxID=2528021 RepID=A0A517Y4R6_9BACT|nr:methyltransferase domain-containing protein [Anatilimnocola aggregata]QDU25231.1 Demethylmenaquinone methyltransferase [Anatilimnocola aggregata]
MSTQIAKRGSSAKQQSLPDYAANLQAFHVEFANELRAMLQQLPIAPGMQVLEVAAGDGQFAIWLNELVGTEGKVTAVDISRAWLKEATVKLEDQQADGVELQQADATQLPFDDASFDFVWCAQSLYSLPRIGDCLAEMRRVLRPGGTLAILENDSLHHLLLPWPVDLELQIHTAQLRAFRAQSRQPARFYAGRWLSRLLRKAGLQRPQERCFASTRQQPLSNMAERYFSTYVQGVRERVEPWLSKRALRRLDQLIDPDHSRCLWKQSDFVAVCIDRVVWAQRSRRAK